MSGKTTSRIPLRNVATAPSSSTCAGSARSRRVATALLDTPAMTQRELCAAVGVSRSTLSFHVNDLIARGILRREPCRPENRYVLEDVELARSILMRYKDSLGDVTPLRVVSPPLPAALPADHLAPAVEGAA